MNSLTCQINLWTDERPSATDSWCSATISPVFLSYLIYIQSCSDSCEKTDAHRATKTFHRSNMNQSSFKGICMMMLVQHFCTSVLHSVIMSALHGSLISNDSRLSAAAINPQLKSRPAEVCCWAEPTPDRRRPKQRDMLLFLSIINEPNNGPAPALPTGFCLQTAAVGH